MELADGLLVTCFCLWGVIPEEDEELIRKKIQQNDLVCSVRPYLGREYSRAIYQHW